MNKKERCLTKRDLDLIRQAIAWNDDLDEEDQRLLTIEEAKVWLLDWLASHGHKVDYN